MNRAFRVTFGLTLLSTTLLSGCGGGPETAGSGGKELLRFRNASLPIAYKEEAFRAELQLSGAVGTQQFRLADGDLPPGIALSGSTLSGTPTQPGSYSFTVRASDGALSSTVQKFSLAVQEQPTPVLALELPVTEVRDTTRIPLRITGARKVGSARLMWRVPAGVTVSAVNAGNAKPLTFWQVKDGKLTVDMGFATAPAREDILAFLSLKVAKPMKMVPGNIGFEVRSSEGKTLNTNALPELVPVVLAPDPVKVSPTRPDQTAKPDQTEQDPTKTPPVPGETPPGDASPTTPPAETPPTAPPNPPGDTPPTPPPGDTPPTTPPVETPPVEAPPAVPPTPQPPTPPDPTPPPTGGNG